MTTPTDRIEEAVEKAVRAYDAIAQTRAKVAALVRREVERERDGVTGEIAAERERQKTFEGWSEAHDDEHVRGELAYAAGCYAGFAHLTIVTPPESWPWSGLWWKQKGARRDLVRAAALIVAEIERLDRADAIRARGVEGLQ